MKVTTQDIIDQGLKFKCLCCSREVIPVCVQDQREFCDCKKTDATEDIYQEAAGGNLSVGYGSSFDSNSYFFVICDQCITEKTNLDLLINREKLRKRYEDS